MSKSILATLVLLTLLSTSPLTFAEQKQTFDQYDIHYSVVNSTFISADVAKAYNIVRGKNRAFINISIRKTQDDGGDKSQRAIVSGYSSDLMREMPLQFKEITEKDAIYYIAEFKFYNEGVRHFIIDVQPDRNRSAYQLKFTKTMYRDL